jgi:small subunit ribosomal protein S13
MPTRIIGVNVEDKWRVDFALTKIKGIGWSKSTKILKDLKINPSTRVSDLTTKDLSAITTKLDEHEVEGDLLRKIKNNLQRLREINSYRGVRHTRGLPVRGQRTKSNARTKRGKRKTVGAYKKEALAKMQTTKKEE